MPRNHIGLGREGPPHGPEIHPPHHVELLGHVACDLTRSTTAVIHHVA